MTASFGDVTGEYLALRRSAALVEASHDLVWVRGPDSVKFLDGLVSQSVAELEPGHAMRSLLLSPQGKLRATLWLARSPDGVGLIADHGVGDDVIGDLHRFKIRVDATIDSEPTPIASLIGPGADRALRDAGLEAPEAGWLDTAGAFVLASPLSRSSLPRFFVNGNVASALVESATVRAGALAATAVRVEAGEPVMGVDIDERTIPQEADVVAGAVSFTKGCYLGQELVARIDSRGHVNRNLRGLVIEANLLPPPGAEVVASDKVVGALTSVAESLDLRAPVALGLIRREVNPGDRVLVAWAGGSASATVRELPLIP